mgnify:CR=1 FL=1
MKRRLNPPAAVTSSSDGAVNADAVLQVKVWLVGISPMVWRRVLVPASFTLRELHGVIQVAMGWDGICSGAQSKCGGRAIKGGFRRRLAETEGGVRRTLFETERTLGETDARSSVPTQNV